MLINFINPLILSNTKYEIYEIAVYSNETLIMKFYIF